VAYEIPSSSIEYLHIPLTGDYTTLMPVEIAIVAHGIEPGGDDWQIAQWDGTAAKVLIGPGTLFALDEGLYGAWARITALPEIPVIYSGLVVVT
jgi:hypothetical protein